MNIGATAAGDLHGRTLRTLAGFDMGDKLPCIHGTPCREGMDT